MNSGAADQITLKKLQKKLKNDEGATQERRDTVRKDLTVDEMIDVFEQLDEATPVYMQCRRPSRRAWYSYQKEHLMAWFYSQHTHGSGAYTRARTNNSAKVTYNRFLCFDGLLWMAEALGESSNVLQGIVDAVQGMNTRQACCKFRSVIPFERIMQLIERPAMWRMADPEVDRGLHTRAWIEAGVRGEIDERGPQLNARKSAYGKQNSTKYKY